MTAILQTNTLIQQPNRQVSRSVIKKALEIERDIVLAETQNNTSLLLSANRTDLGNAECLAALHGNGLRYCHTRRKWLTWAESKWTIDGDGKANRLMIETCRERYRAAAEIEDLEARKRFAAFAIASENSNKVTASLRSAESHTQFATTIERYDSDEMLVTAGDKTINLRTCEAREPRFIDYISLTLGTHYDPKADCPRWKQFIHEVMGGHTGMVEFLQRATGYSLTGSTREQKLFLLLGDGANGKSIFLNLLSALLGDYAAASSFDCFDADQRNTVGNDLAVLKGKRLVTVIESDADRRLSEARVKAVTGGDAISCRFLYGEPFNYRPTWKLWLATNSKPVIKGTDNGIWRRILLIPFEQSFAGREDKNLDRTLRAELPGILNWALEGLRSWHEQGLNPPAKITEATNEYRSESDIFGQWLDLKTLKAPRAETPAMDLFRSYKDFCFEIGLRHSPVMQSWGREMASRGYTKERKRTGYVYFGIGLPDPDPSFPAG